MAEGRKGRKRRRAIEAGPAWAREGTTLPKKLVREGRRASPARRAAEEEEEEARARASAACG